MKLIHAKIRAKIRWGHIVLLCCLLSMSYSFIGCQTLNSSQSSMLSHKLIAAPNAPKAIGPYSQAIKAGKMLFVSGQIGLDPDSGKIVEGGIETETRRVMNNIKNILAAAGFSLADVVRTQVFLADISEYKQMNSVYASFFPDASPARVVIQAAGIPRDARLEVSAIAVKAQ